MELQNIQRNSVENLIDFAPTGVNEQADGSNERRQGRNNFAGLLHGHSARTLGVENQTDGISPCMSGNQSVFDASDPAYLAANDGQGLLTYQKGNRMVTKDLRPASE